MAKRGDRGWGVARGQAGTVGRRKARRQTTGRWRRSRPTLQQLEDRLLLSLGAATDPRRQPLPIRIEPASAGGLAPLQVVLVNQDVPQAREIAMAAVPGVITLLYDPATIDGAGLVRVLGVVSALHGNAPIGHLALVAHGSPGRVDIAAGDRWDLGALAANTGEFAALRSELAPDARIDLYACDVAAGPMGRALVDQLAAATGAVVSASDDIVGTVPGGDFNWEYVTGAGPRPADLLSVNRLRRLEPFALDDQFDNVQWNDYLPWGYPPTSLGAIPGDTSWYHLSIYHSSGYRDEDWYTFTTFQQGTSSNYVYISFDNYYGWVYLELYDSSYHFLTGSYGSGDSQLVNLNGLAPGTYEIRVVGYYNSSYFITNPDYMLEVNPPVLDWLEYNDTAATATILGSYTMPLDDLSIDPSYNHGGNNDVDWYFLQTYGTGTSSSYVQINFLDSWGDLDMKLYDSQLNEIGSSTGTGNSETISLNTLPMGNYFVKVYGYGGAVNPYYNLSVVYPPPGDYFDQAAAGVSSYRNDYSPYATYLGTLSGPDQTWSGLSLYYPGTTDVDWYTFTTTTGGTSADDVHIDFDGTVMAMGLAVYDYWGDLIGYSSVAGDHEEVSLADLPAGTYYAVVYPVAFYNPYLPPNYDLTIDAPQVVPDTWDQGTRNDTFATATNLGIVEGLFQQANLSIDSATDLDWIEFATAATGGLADYARIDFANAAGDLDMALFDQSGNLLDWSNSTNNFEQISLQYLPQGTYYLVVYGYSSTTNPSYNLTLHTPQTLAADAFDAVSRNDTSATATDLDTYVGPNPLPNLSVAGLSIDSSTDVDWYEFTLPAGSVSGDAAQIVFDSSLGDLDMALYASSDLVNPVAISEGITNSEQVSFAGLVGGTYYVAVYGFVGETNPSYTLTVTTPGAAPTGGDASWEHDDTYATAHDFGQVQGMNIWGDGSPNNMAPLSISRGSDVDWYRFTLTATGTPGNVAGIAFNNTLGDLDLMLYASDGTTLIDDSAGVRNVEEVSLAGLSAGDYYLEVIGYNGASNPAYALYINAPGGDRFEGLAGTNGTGNNDSADATDLTNVTPDSRSGDARTWNNLSIDTTSDVDWFQFTLPAAPVAGNFVQIAFDGMVGDLDLRLYGPDGTTLLAQSIGTTSTERIDLTGLNLQPDTTYYVKVYGYNQATNPLYSLTLNAVLGSATIPPDSAEQHGGFSDDDTQAHAYDLGTVQGLSNFFDHPYSINTSTDVDWYEFTISNPGVPGNYAAIGFNNALGDLDLYVVRPDGTEVSHSATSSNVELVSLAGLAAGTYYLKVVGNNGATNPNYVIQFLAPPGSSGDWAETSGGRLDNDTSANADDFGTVSGALGVSNLSIYAAGDVDWYRLTTAATGILGNAVSIAFDQNQGDLDMALYSASNLTTPLATSNGVASGEQVSLQGEPAGTYYVKVYGKTSSVTNPSYSLEILAPQGGAGDWSEPNNDPAQPLNFNANKPVAYDLREVRGQQYWGGLSIQTSSDVDWYEIHTVATGQPDSLIGLSFDDTLGDLDLYVYRSDGTPVGQSTTADNQEVVSLAGQPAGDYYIEVVGYAGATNPSYYLFTNTPENPSIPADWAESHNGLGDNNMLNHAYDLQQVQGVQSWSGLNISSSDEDWFQFTTAGAGVDGNAVSIAFDNSQGNLDLELYASDGTWIASSTGDANQEQISLLGLPAGSYDVRILGKNGDTNPSYTLTIDAPQIPTPDWAEYHAGLNDDNTRAHAYDLREIQSATILTNLSIDSSSDTDWYRFDTLQAAGPSQYVRIDFRQSYGALNVQLDDSAGNPISTQATANANNSIQISLAGLAAGSYYIQVSGAGGATNPNYVLTVFASPGLSPDWAESHGDLTDNNSLANAYDLGEVAQSIADRQARLFGNLMMPASNVQGRTSLLGTIFGPGLYNSLYNPNGTFNNSYFDQPPYNNDGFNSLVPGAGPLFSQYTGGLNPNSYIPTSSALFGTHSMLTDPTLNSDPWFGQTIGSYGGGRQFPRIAGDPTAELAGIPDWRPIVHHTLVRLRNEHSQRLEFSLRSRAGCGIDAGQPTRGRDDIPARHRPEQR